MAKLTKEQLAQVQQYIETFPEEERDEKLKEVTAQFEQETPQCPFCLMSEGKIQTTKIYEDSNFLSVLEINPGNKGHTLLFPKRHVKSLSNLNEQETEAIIKIIKNLSQAVSKISEGVNVLISEGKAANQRFEHLVINLIPRSNEDSIKISWPSKQATEKELSDLKQRIIENIPKEKPKEIPLDTDKLKSEFNKHKKRLP